MALPDFSYAKIVGRWGADATAGFVWPPFSWSPWRLAGPGDELSGTGVSGTDWAPAHTHEVLRQAGYNFASGWSLTHLFSFSARLATGNGILRFRLQDVTNDLTLAHYAVPAYVQYAIRWEYRTAAFSDIPSADARVQLQYSLPTGELCEFRWATWEVVNNRTPTG